MGEPLNFVAGGERHFKNYLRELLVILCIRESDIESAGAAGGGGLPTLMGTLVLVRTEKSHDVTRMSQACEISSKPSQITPTPLLFSPNRTTSFTATNRSTKTHATTIGAGQGATHWVPPNLEFRTTHPFFTRNERDAMA